MTRLLADQVQQHVAQVAAVEHAAAAHAVAVPAVMAAEMPAAAEPEAAAGVAPFVGPAVPAFPAAVPTAVAALMVMVVAAAAGIGMVLSQRGSPLVSIRFKIYRNSVESSPVAAISRFSSEVREKQPDRRVPQLDRK